MTQKFHEFTIDIPGFNVAAKSIGLPSNPPMLALHGWLDNANSFDGIAEKFANHFHFIAIDLPGHGYSSHLAAGYHYHFIDGIGIVREIVQALGFSSVHLLGHSMGACLASMVGGVLNGLCDSLFLIEGLGPLSAPSSTAVRQLQRYYEYDRTPQSHLRRAYDSRAHASEARAKRGHVSLELAATLSQRGVAQVEGKYYWRHDPRLIQPSPLRLDETVVLSALKNITAKSVLITANRGFDFGASLLQERIQSVAQLQLFQEEGGHHLHMENPERIYAIAETFYQL